MIALARDGPWLKRRVPRLPSGIWSLYGFTVLWVVGILLPLIVVLLVSFLKTKGLTILFEPNFVAYEKILIKAGGSVIMRTFRIALTMTLIELLLAFPFALWLAKGTKNYTLKLATFTLLTVPFFLSPGARIFVWRSLLARGGLVNNVLISLGIVDEPVEWLLFSEFAVHFGLVGTYFPTMVWPIFLSIALIDDDYLESSKDLGASRLRTLIHIIIPLSLPGIVAGFVFTFIPMLGDTATPQMMGGNKAQMLSQSVQTMISGLNYTVAAALSAFALVAMLLLQVVLWAALKPLGGLNQVFQVLRR